MAEEKKQLIRMTTPKGKALWPFLVTPDSRFAETGKAPQYKVNLILTPEEAKPLIDKLTPEVDAAFEDAKSKAKPNKKKDLAKHAPWDDDYDKDGNATGNLVFKFHMNSFYKKKDGTMVEQKPALFDGVGQKIERKLNIGNGSIIRVNFVASPFFMDSNRPSAGISLLINAVQIIKLVEYGNGGDASSYGFGAEDDAFADTGEGPSAGDAGPAEQKEGDF